MLSRAILFLSLLVTLHAAAAPETYVFKRIVIADAEAAALAVTIDTASPKSVYADKVPLFEGSDFEKAIAPFLGKPITPDMVNRLSTLLSEFARTHDRLLANVQIPNQNVADGTLRFAVIIGRFNELSVRGNRWFSSQLLQEKLGIKPGDEVRLSVLESAVNWANTNPFRRVKVIVNPIETQPGEANLLIGVQDIRPWRFAASADNYGNEILGQWHYTGSLQAGNLWGRDHQASYQFVTTDNVHTYQAHVLDYNVPLPWRHFIEATASYVRLNPVFGVNNVLAQAARSEALDLKYTIPIRNGDNPIEFHTGIDFSRSNNNLEYAGTRVYGSDVDTFQWTSGGSIVKHDKHGGWLFAASVSLSPGGIDGRNHSTAFRNARFGSNPRYAYGTLSVQRALSLGHGWDLSSRLLGQIASTNLVSGQMTIGGPTSVRGFKTNLSAGDQGVVFNNDLLTPTITTSLEKFGKKLPPLETRFAVFYDAGNVDYKFRYYFDPKNRPLAGAGVGLRMSVANNFTLSFDYGWQITRQPYQANEHSYGHFKVGLAF